MPDCDVASRQAIAPASVWYSRKKLLVNKGLQKGDLLATIVADADPNCPAWRCLFEVSSGRVSGANPMGANAEVAANPAAVAAGLPYDEIVVPVQGLSIGLDDQASGAVLTLVDAASKRLGPYAAAAGRVQVPFEVLEPGAVYSYQWQSQGVDIRGSFSVARAGTVKRANLAAEAMNAADPSPAGAKLALASAYLRVGLLWNARQLIGEIERGE